MTAADVVAAVRHGRYRYTQETQFHLGLEAAMTAAGLAPVPEVRLTARDRIDFLVDRVGVEVKIKGTADALHRQLLRYAASDQLDELLVITTVPQHRSLPPTLNDKPLTVLVIGALA